MTKETRATSDPADFPVRPDLLVQKAIKAMPVPLALQDQRVTKVIRATPGSQALPVR